MFTRVLWVRVSAAIGIASLLLAAAVRCPNEIATIFTWAPRRVYPAGLLARVREVQKRIPENALLLYIEPKVDYWQFGLWKRALHPRNSLELVVGEETLNLKPTGRWSRYALVVGRTIDSMQTTSAVALPAYEGSPAVYLVEIR